MRNYEHHVIKSYRAMVKKSKWPKSDKLIGSVYAIWKVAKEENWSDDRFKQALVDAGFIKKKSDWDKPVEPPEKYEDEIRKSHRRDPNTYIPLVH